MRCLVRECWRLALGVAHRLLHGGWLSLPADNVRGNSAINHAAVERLQVSSYRVTLTSASRERKVRGTNASREI